MTNPEPRLPRVALVTGKWGRNYADVEGSSLEGRATVTRVHWGDDTPVAERAAWLDGMAADTEALLFSPWFLEGIPEFTHERWERFRRLRVISGTFDNRFGRWLSIAEADARGVTVVDTSRSMTLTVAEYVLAMTMNLLLDVPAAVQAVRQGGWRQPGWDHPGWVFGDLTGRTVGLAGYGMINRRYRELLEPFRCTVLAHDPYVDVDEMETAGIEPVGSLEELAARSEIFSIGIPPTPATEGIVSADVIDALPRGSLLVLATRMAVMDQQALWRRAEAGEIKAAVDVFDPEPPPSDASFRTSPFVLPTPHIAGNAGYCHRRCFTTAAADALAVLCGEEPRYRATLHDEMVYEGLIASGSSETG